MYKSQKNSLFDNISMSIGIFFDNIIWLFTPIRSPLYYIEDGNYTNDENV